MVYGEGSMITSFPYYPGGQVEESGHALMVIGLYGEQGSD